MIDEILEAYPDEQFLRADGLDAAVIGLDATSMRLIYSAKRCVEILAEQMGEEDALEFFDYNVLGSWVGDRTPIFCIDLWA